ncbi:MAG: hypothetical protein BroJett029_04980 [Alphaproteobacteria bacterium]|jgi:photosystem II stability/assembly factor-like uncharacterized protein|nr:MAG: hypothetical protein BroJett029_04980 [Alphaproteobacteria bacterium]
MVRLFSKAICAIATGFIASIPIAAASAEPRKLTDVLEATHVHGLAVDADDSNRLLIATHHGLFALDLASGMAEPISETRDDFMGFTPHPTDSGVLYASGHPAAGGNLGIIVSKDGGRTWTSLSPGLNGPVDFHQMDVSRADPKIIYGAHGGLQVSRDGGTTWELVGPLPEGLIDFAASAASADTLYAATKTGLLVSRDGGRRWQESESGGPVAMVHVSAGGDIHAFSLKSGLLTAREETTQWRSVGAGPIDAIILHLAVDPADSLRLYAATYQGDLLASEDGGESWRSLRTP